jgi:hypothetical protein
MNAVQKIHATLAAIDPFYASCLTQLASSTPCESNPQGESRRQHPAVIRKVQIGPATLYQGDCFDIMPTLEPIQGVVTDPPFGIGFKYRSYDDAPDR